MRFELRALLRSRASTVALLAYLAIGVLAIGLGARHVAEWSTALETARQAEAETIVEARGYFASGVSGPEDQPWVDLAQPMWQDRFAGTRVVREPGALAGVAAGSVDAAPVAFHVHRRADPLAVGGARIENPEISGGTVDLAFVLAMLTPLLVGVLGLGIGGREREERIDRLVTVHAGGVREWLVARMVAVAVIASAAATVLCLAAGAVGGASPTDVGVLVALSVAYTALWSGWVLATTGRAATVRGGAFAFGALWTVVCVLIPAVVAEVGLGTVQADYAVADTLDARALQYGAYEEDLADLTERLYARYPELRDLPAASVDELPGPVRRHAYDGVLVGALRDRHEDRLAHEAAARGLAELASGVSPPIALTLALERIAGVGPEAAAAYRSHLVAAVEARVYWLVVHAWRMEPLAQADFDAVVAGAPAAFRWQPTGLLGPGGLLVLWTVVGWVLAFVGLGRRGDGVG